MVKRVIPRKVIVQKKIESIKVIKMNLLSFLRNYFVGHASVANCNCKIKKSRITQSIWPLIITELRYVINHLSIEEDDNEEERRNISFACQQYLSTFNIKHMYIYKVHLTNILPATILLQTIGNLGLHVCLHNIHSWLIEAIIQKNVDHKTSKNVVF